MEEVNNKLTSYVYKLVEILKNERSGLLVLKKKFNELEERYSLCLSSRDHLQSVNRDSHTQSQLMMREFNDFQNEIEHLNNRVNMMQLEKEQLEETISIISRGNQVKSPSEYTKLLE